MSTTMNTSLRSCIDKIPTEMFLEIIKLATTVSSDNDRKHSPSYLLNSLSLVCKAWRDVIRGVPELWTTIYGSEPPSQIRAIIALTRQMPLQLYGDDGKNPITGRVAKMLFAELHRMSVFEMYLHQEDLRSNVSLLDADCDASLLESFALWIEGAEEEDEEEEETTLDLFGGKALPRLTKLSLGGCKLSWDTAALNNLTSLRLASPNRCESRCFVDALSRMSSLEELFLTRCVPLDFAQDSITTTIDFPRLSTLSFDDYIGLCTALLQRSRFQRLTHLIVVADSFERENNEEYRALFDICRSHLSPYFETYPALHLAIETTLYSVQTTALSRVNDVTGQFEEVLSITLELPAGGVVHVDAELVALSFNMVPVCEVQSLRCHLHCQMHPRFWSQTVSTAFPHLEGLFVDAKTLRGIMVALFQELKERIEQMQRLGVVRQELSFQNLRQLIAPVPATLPHIYATVLAHRETSGLRLTLADPIQ